MSDGTARNNLAGNAASFGPGMTEAGRWFVVQTQPHQENRAILNLHQQGYRTFCPRIRKTVRHARRAHVVLAPLFPAYFFVPLDPARDRWRSINGTRGVVRIVANGDGPTPVPQGVVEELQDRLNTDGSVDWSSSLELGQPVRIADGPFADLIGTLEHMAPDGRVRVLLGLLGRPVSVSLRQESLIPVA